MPPTLDLHFQRLHLPFKTTVRHASASRSTGSSVWVQASRNNLSGFGEGCPRRYVTGESIDSCLAWYEKNTSRIVEACTDIDALKRWLSAESATIDTNPSAWCAIEIALLDLFAREAGVSVENLVGLSSPQREYGYTAVLGDDEEWKYRILLDMYLAKGFSDFKIKLNGDLKKDNAKLRLLAEHAAQHGVGQYRARLDANNLWRDNVDLAISHLQSLEHPFFAIEEPVIPKDAEALSRISLALDKPVILDESLCTLADLQQYDNLNGQFIANIKVSRVGGVLRALDIVAGLKERGWPIIIGAHVGETSVLTRAAMCVAQAAGDQLIAQEGCFGTLLVEYDLTQPSLNYSHKGRLDLSKPYAEKTPDGLKVYPPNVWNTGWGLQSRSPELEFPEEASIQTLEMPDGYAINYRLWGPEKANDVLVVLHGGMSHSGWQAPLAKAIRDLSDFSVVAPDRRGCGLNANPGDFGSVQLVVDDVIHQINDLKASFDRVHLVGWCQGGAIRCYRGR